METFEIYRGVKRNIVDTSRAAPGVVVAWWSACGSTADELLRAVGRGRFLTNFCVWRYRFCNSIWSQKACALSKKPASGTTRRGENQAVNSSRAESVPNLNSPARANLYYY